MPFFEQRLIGYFGDHHAENGRVRIGDGGFNGFRAGGNDQIDFFTSIQRAEVAG